MSSDFPQANLTFAPGQEPEVVYPNNVLKAPAIVVVSVDWLSSLDALLSIAVQHQEIKKAREQIRAAINRA